MDDLEFERLRKTICRSFNSSPHKKKYWLALLEMRAEADKLRQAAEQKSSEPPPRCAVTPAE
jgi:hypothetical protein